MGFCWVALLIGCGAFGDFAFGAYRCVFCCISNSTSSLYYHWHKVELTNVLLLILTIFLIKLFWFYKDSKAKHEIKRKYTARDEMIWVVKIPSEWAKKHLDFLCCACVVCTTIFWRAFSFASMDKVLLSSFKEWIISKIGWFSK